MSRTKAIILLLLLTLAVIAISVFAFDSLNTNLINSTSVNQSNIVPKSEVLDASRKYIGTSYNDLNLIDVEDEIEKIDLVAECNASISFSNELTLRIVEKEVVALCRFGDKFQFLCSDGTLAAYRQLNDYPEVPLLVYNSSFDKVELMKNAERIQLLSSSFSELNNLISHFTITKSNIDFTLTDLHVKVLLGDLIYQDSEKLFKKFNTIWNSDYLATNFERINYIDLRWSDKVIIGKK